ncbi:integrase core domain protein [Oesophagostomum dentatum]|uniref:Integrase core domain protein n=1 Tax=Oesophagostomum dentatum TaxID=61180 RepID=A0A0B1T1Q9_OESDE|nr:integrase core domain protein [Oesophagostomum dentatum]
MTTLLSTYKRQLTNYGNKLEAILSKIKAEKLEIFSVESALSHESVQENVSRIKESISAIESATSKTEEILNKYATTLDTTGELTAKEKDDFQEYYLRIETILLSAFDYLVILRAHCASLSSPNIQNQARTQASFAQDTSGIRPQTMELPSLPVPSFSGNTWEWDNFWELFNTNIHSQDIPELSKFNYLIKALRGEARQSIQKFQITKENYSTVIHFLKNKYDNKEILINHLVDRLDTCKLRNASAKGQRVLLEQIQAITNQLVGKGEQVDSSWLIKKVLSKFPDSTKRKVISKKQGASESSFTMNLLIKFLDEIISAEEMFSLYTEKTEEKQSRTMTTKSVKTPFCMYCNDHHSSFSCPKYKTAEERSLYLRQNHLCLVCASPSHKTSECKKRQCFNCQGAHHTSCCFRNKKELGSLPTNKGSQGIQQHQQRVKAGVKVPKKQNQVPSANSIQIESAVAETPILQVQNILKCPQLPSLKEKPYLPMGEVSLFNPTTKSNQKVQILFDTGAEISFIDEGLAQQLQLPVLAEKTVQLHTFGAAQPCQQVCQLVSMKITDKEGTMHTLNLLTHKTLTQSLQVPTLSKEDEEMIRSLKISAQFTGGSATAKPSILLGCDQLWNFIESDSPPTQLPSGLYLLRTKFGSVISGVKKSMTQEFLEYQNRYSEEEYKWDSYWSMDANVHTIIQQDVVSSEEQEQWEKYWGMDAAGTSEFNVADKQVRQILDQRIWDQFNDSIERRQDGYYVRLQWKENHPPLPDNKAIAHKRLINVWASLRKDEELLEQYNNVFKDQESKNIIEEISEGDTIQDLNMNLREFASNNNDLLQSIPKHDQSSSLETKVLGIPWQTNSDILTIKCNFLSATKYTKRYITSAIASIYDPLGWTLPLLHKAKVFLQKLWKDQYDWDTVLPTKLCEEWEKIASEVNDFKKLLPRKIACKGEQPFMATFADASNTGMAACTYLVSSVSNLLMARGKLPSLHTKSTIPKLELNAITLGMRLTKSIIDEIKYSLKIGSVYIFSDSEIVLSWVSAEPNRDVGTYVFNRLFEIRSIIEYLKEQKYEVYFCYVPTELNPADKATRGLTKVEMFNQLWWEGPVFLHTDRSSWPTKDKIFKVPVDYSIQNVNQPKETIYNTSEYLQNCVEAPTIQELLSKKQVLTLSTAKRVVAFVLRFVCAVADKVNAKTPNKIRLSLTKNAGSSIETIQLTGEEINRAGKTLIRNHQRARINKQVISSLKHLNLRKDEEGIWRCFGRLGLAQLDQGARFPIFVLQKTLLAEIIIREYHQKGHPGINHTIALVRQEFWIPQLRAQVTQLIRKCVQCQKFNNLPYRYPNQDDLPKERVTRSRPFEHIGLDYFGPILVKLQNEDQEKCFGTIITCMVTRLIHLDVVTSLSTVAFIHMLRRFFARRGIPKSITCDNAPTFGLGEEILQDYMAAFQQDSTVAKELSNREITWKNITPYAPWQGGFYERLIKSVKYSMYKTLGKSPTTYEELFTTLTEIEALLNSRPLTYITNDINEQQILRPIDFLQRDIQIIYPFTQNKEESQDPEYLPAEKRLSIETKTEAIKAINSSCEKTEKFWNQWQKQYLTALREKHILQVPQKRGGRSQPKVGTVVLIQDAVQPRYTWKLAMIKELIASANNQIRTALLRLPSGRTIKRPINLLVPLELKDNTEQDTQIMERDPSTSAEQQSGTEPADKERATQSRVSARYNLRPQARIHYNEGPSNLQKQTNSVHTSTIAIASCLLLLFVSCVNAETQHASNNLTIQTIQCIQGGIKINMSDPHEFEICAEGSCSQFTKPQGNETIRFPPYLVLHKHTVQWKIFDGSSIKIIKITCPPAPFCEQIQCTFCSPTIFNPECWPLRSMIAIAAILYFLITGCYVFLYVPIVLGRPLRIVANILWSIFRLSLKMIRQLRFFRANPRHRKRTIAEILALAITLYEIILVAHGCQDVNLFTHYSSVCANNSPGEPCHIQLSEIFKINPFKRESCVRLSQNHTSVHEIRLVWKSLQLTCEPETELFTRDTIYKVIDSKRCAHSGSCNGNKCNSINSSSLIPELAEANLYPGITSCVESCGGPGCDCFYLSSGCLFYRIYLKPINDQVFELFHCNRWVESAKVEVTHFDVKAKKLYTRGINMIPNIPVKWKAFTFILSELSFPPIPLLNSHFISSGNGTALWPDNILPALRCTNYSNAVTLTCQVYEDCECLPAETKANCKCKEFSRIAMAQKNDYADDFQRLNSFHKIETCNSSLQDEIKTVEASIRRTFRVLKPLTDDWKQHKDSNNQEDAGERLIVATRFFRTTSTTREKLIGLVSRYLLAVSMQIHILKAHVFNADKKKALERMNYHQKSEEIRREASEQLLMLDKISKEMEQEITEAERAVKGTRADVVNYQQDKIQLIEFFNKTLASVDDRLKTISKHVTEEEESCRSTDSLKRKHSNDEKEQDNKVRIKEDDENTEDAEQLEEEARSSRSHSINIEKEELDYGEEDLEEVHLDEDSGEQSQGEQEQESQGEDLIQERNEDGQYQEIDPPPADEMDERNVRIRRLEDEINDLRGELRWLPVRRIGETSRGVDPSIVCTFCKDAGRHYSDSCPMMTNGNQRFYYVQDNDLCKYCLMDCEPSRPCPSRRKRCWYCERVEHTVLDFLIPRDGGHHRALCSIPDARPRVMQLIEHRRQELKELRGD